MKIPISQPEQDQFLIFLCESSSQVFQHVGDAERLYQVEVIQKGKDGEPAATLCASASLSIDLMELPQHGLQRGSSDL